MVCPPWNGVDTSGRPVCPDSFWTKTPGCNSADDRVVVENNLRPQYMEYVNLDAQGIRGDLYNYDMSSCPGGMIQRDEMVEEQTLKDVHNITGQFGLQTGFRQNVQGSCNAYNYVDRQGQLNQMQRATQNGQEGFLANRSRMRSGMAY